MPELRPVSQAVQEAIGSLPQGSFNFGLYFQKWFYVDADNWKCPTDKKRGRDDTGFSLLDNLDVSLKFFNGESIAHNGRTYRWNIDASRRQLDLKHQNFKAVAAALKNLGYEEIVQAVPLLTPLVIGLGNEHPTEKGFRFDWTLGIPYIPASSIKGVVRLAYLVNQLNLLDDADEAESFWQALKADKIPPGAQQFFGAGGEKTACRGGVIFFDAYPKVLPKLKAEIMNCHYPKYFQGDRGPSEDQQPNPQKFWALDTRDGDNQPTHFIFRFLLHPNIASSGYRQGLLNAFTSALRDHGLGAKTAIGHGRFGPEAEKAPHVSTEAGVKESVQAEKASPVGAKPAPAPTAAPATVVQEKEIWEKATLSWNPGAGELTAVKGQDKAFTKGKGLVPEAMHKNLFQKKKAVTATVTVERLGNASRIIAIE